MERDRTKYLGVYQRQSDTRTYNGKPDVCFDVTFKRDGKKIWEKIGWVSEGYTAKIASELRANRVRNVRHGEELPKDKKKTPLFKDVAKEYLKWAAENKTRNGRDDKNLYENHLKSRFENKRLNEISSFTLERLKNELTKCGLAPGSVKHCLVLFRQMFNKAVLWGMYKGDNPIKGVKLPILHNQRERFLRYDEATVLLNDLRVDKSKKKNPGAKKDPQLHDMALLSLHCGLRAGEIFNIKGQDLDFENGLINISDPKNKVGRKAFMTNAVKDMLKNREPDSPAEYIFKDRKHGGKISGVPVTFGRTVKRLGFNNGITEPHKSGSMC